MNLGHTEVVMPGMAAATTLPPMPQSVGRRSSRRELLESSEFKEKFHNRLDALYDAARTTHDNERYWASADFLSPNASLTPEVRSRVRSRARYEIANDSFACGMLETMANDAVGPGPRLNIGNQQIERAWKRWSSAVRLGRKLRTAVKQKKGNDGESIWVEQTNPILRTPAKLDFIIYEGEQCTTPWRPEVDERKAVDGINFDAYGNPQTYFFLKSHPGGSSIENAWETVPMPARYVHHWFREDRPGQRRGLPELTPALSLFANRRRFVLATIAAAEVAASYSAIMYTDQPVDVADLDETDWFSSIPIEYRAMLTLPDGWRMQQFQSEHPTTTFPDFQKAIVTEMARCWSMPRNIAMGDSAEMTYSSGQLDHLIYWQAINVERSDLTDMLLEPIFESWLREHLSASSGISVMDIDLDQPEYDHEWIWPVRPSRDPLKDAQAAVTLFDRGLMVDSQWWIEQGFDPDRMREQLAESIEIRQEMGAPVPGIAVTNTTTDGEGEQTGEDQAEQNAETAGSR